MCLPSSWPNVLHKWARQLVDPTSPANAGNAALLGGIEASYVRF